MNDNISRAKLFDRLATITAEDANEMKAKIYAVIQEMPSQETIGISIAEGFAKAFLDKIGAWIPSSIKTPEYDVFYDGDGEIESWDGPDVLVSCKNGDYPYRRVGIASYGPDGWYSEDDALGELDVLAWMPLPDPYESEEESE